MEPIDEHFCAAGDVELCYEPFGDPADPAILLVMGLGTQMLGWPTDFCRQLAGRGFFVVRYDNRDVGHSTHFRDARPPTPLELVTRKPKDVAYTLEDMADDGMRLLDCLGVERAHVVGASMGGMIAQAMAVRHQDRVLSLTSIMSTTGGRWVGQPALRVYPFFLGQPPRDEDAYVERIVRLFAVVGSHGLGESLDELRESARTSFRRGVDPAGTARQLAAIAASGDRTRDVRRIVAPTLVIHGTRDRLVRPSGGKATHKAIGGSKLMLVEGMGHDLPRGAWPRMLDGIVENTARAGAPRLADAA